MQLESEDQIDIVALIAKVWKSKKLIFKSMLVFGVLGVLVAISTQTSSQPPQCLPQIIVISLQGVED